MDIKKLILTPLNSIFIDVSSILKIVIKNNYDLNVLNSIDEFRTHEFYINNSIIYYKFKQDILDIKETYYQSTYNNLININTKILIVIKNYIKIITAFIIYYTINRAIK